MDKNEFINCMGAVYRDIMSCYCKTNGTMEAIEGWRLPEELQKKVEDSILEEIKSHPLPFRRYSPSNPTSKEWLSNLPPIAVPIHPEMIKPIDTPNFWFDQFLSYRPFEEVIKINMSEEKTVMQAKAVIDLYFKRARAALDKAVEDKFRQLVDEDENVKKIRSTFDKLNDDLSTMGFRPKLGVPDHQIKIYCTAETRAKFEKWSEKEADERKRLDRMREEVEAQLLSCETYGQAMEILRAYKIVDRSGKMWEYVPFSEKPF